MRYPYGKIQRLYDNLQKNQIATEIVDEIMKDGERIKQTDKNDKKSKWFYSAMKTMDEKLDPPTRYKIREECACCLGGKRHELCRQINKNQASTKSRVDAADRTKFVFGNSLREIEKGRYEVSFFPESLERKQCVCLKDLPEAMSITYCYCCAGHVKHHLQTLLGQKLEVNVITSALSTKGHEGCRFELYECVDR